MSRDRSTMHLDPRGPLVVDTRELGRSPGAMRRQSRTVPAPADLGLDLIGVPESADVELEVRLEAVMEGVLVSGVARAPLTGECARCLDPFVRDTEVDFQELYAYPDQEPEEDAYQMEGDLLDLEPAFRDALVLALPVHPLCQPGCPGLCAECGARLADVGPDHSHPTADPRWAALQGLLERQTDNDENEES